MASSDFSLSSMLPVGKRSNDSRSRFSISDDNERPLSAAASTSARLRSAGKRMFVWVSSLEAIPKFYIAECLHSTKQSATLT
jgi:hypothetical protein